jgi:hypothetical protein
MSDPAPARRPTPVALLWTYCAAMIMLGLIVLAVAVVMMVHPELFDMDEPEDYFTLGGVVAFAGLAIMLFHTVPMFLKRDDTAWRVIHGFLIAYIVIWGLTVFSWPVMLFPALLLGAWRRPTVKAYYNVVVENVRGGYNMRRPADWDDGWDEEWDKPRQAN